MREIHVFMSPLSLIIYSHFFTVWITHSTTLTLKNLHRRAEAYQIKQLLYRNSFSRIFLAFYALHFFSYQNRRKKTWMRQILIQETSDSLPKSCFHLCFCYLVVSKTFLVEKPLQNLVSLSSPVHILQCQGHAACFSNGGKLVVNYQRKWGHKNMDFSHIRKNL